MLQFDVILLTTEFLYVITNHATDAIKAVVHLVNMKFRKLKKNNVRNTNKTRQLKQEELEVSSLGIHDIDPPRVTIHLSCENHIFQFII